MIRTLLICLFTCLILLNLYWLALGVIIYYSIKFNVGIELLVLGVLLDGYYGAFYHWPMFTLVALFLWYGSIKIKAKLLLYTE
jgi:hypothetical protein